MTLLNHAPRFAAESASQLAYELYGIRSTAAPLPSERDQNFLLPTEPGDKFVLKIANATENRAMLEAQQQAMTLIAEQSSFCPRIMPSLTGDTIIEVRAENSNHFAWLITYLEGVPLGSVNRHSDDLLRELGRCLGQVDRALAEFDHPAIHRDFHWDLANGLREVRKFQPLILENDVRQLVGKLADEFERETSPLLPHLRRSAIHNDANDYNVLVGGGNDLYSRNQRVVGLVDFGDMVFSYTIGDLAIAIAYAILDKSDPLAAATQIVAGYQAENPLTEAELSALFGLVKLRLCVSVCMAAHQQRQRPDDEYLTISQQPIRSTLPRLAAIHPRFAETAFRHACGLKKEFRVPPLGGSLGDQIQPPKGGTLNFSSVIDADLRTEPLIVFDLSVSSPLLSGDAEENSEPKLTKRLFGLMKSAGVTVGVGRYDEARMLYVTPLFAADTRTGEARTVHLGIDLFVESGSAVYAPLAGEVHSFHNNNAPLDYGPVIILKHKTDAKEFFTLYGHLSEDSLEGLYVGQPIAAGQRIASIGAPPTNGNWTPHLHFQIITDLLDLGYDFPGVCRASERELWREFSPDPNLILGIPADRFPPIEPSKSETLIRRRRRIGRNLSIGYRNPVKVVRGWRQYLFDETGRQYLDAYNNVPHVGHCHPRIIEAACKQMAVLNTNTRYLHDAINRYAEELCATLPENLSVCFFINSASEANELALRLARAHTLQKDLIVLEAAYHGHTTGLIDISPYKHGGPGGNGAPDWVHTVPIPDGYRGVFKYDDPQSGDKYASHVRDVIERLKANGKGLAGFIAETCPSVGGQIFLPSGYLASVYAAVRSAGGVCIADEVQTGLGRIGTDFWAFQAHGVAPDIVVMGKPIGNGHPIGAVVTTPEIADSFNNGMEFFSTFGGNPVSCAVGLEVLHVVREENLQEHALRIGNRMLEALHPFVDRFPLVGDVRGSGLFLGVELVRDRVTLEPAAEETSFVANRMRDHGILLGTDGPHHNVIKIRPPMPFDEANADFLVNTMADILARDFQ
ncbi:MAG: aminotransferase class III-fold pyridoxal phosphate-dependent enzyme [Acidobacteria bacterium]|nr:aminotransferase class III-fold pyridoxal phosphate-dependent enzyme [Acidobacteriota bacterium]